MTRMIAMVSSISLLLRALTGASCPVGALSNVCATAEPVALRFKQSRLLLCFVAVALIPRLAFAQPHAQNEPRDVNGPAAVGGFLAGVVVGLAAHESGHVLFDVIFDADPGVKRVEFNGIPFFAITHRSGLPPREEFTISSAGFWVQHAT